MPTPLTAIAVIPSTQDGMVPQTRPTVDIPLRMSNEEARRLQQVRKDSNRALAEQREADRAAMGKARAAVCPTPHKRAYHSQGRAREAREALIEGGSALNPQALVVYECICGTLHLGNTKRWRTSR